MWVNEIFICITIWRQWPFFLLMPYWFMNRTTWGWIGILLTVIICCCPIFNFRHLITEKRDNITWHSWLLTLYRQLVKFIYKLLTENCLTQGIVMGKYYILTSQSMSEQKNKCLCDNLFVIQTNLFTVWNEISFTSFWDFFSMFFMLQNWLNLKKHLQQAKYNCWRWKLVSELGLTCLSSVIYQL